jgi:hypothetical protein
VPFIDELERLGVAAAHELHEVLVGEGVQVLGALGAV